MSTHSHQRRFCPQARPCTPPGSSTAHTS
jgi:hypothetical protein